MEFKERIRKGLEDLGEQAKRTKRLVVDKVDIPQEDLTRIRDSTRHVSFTTRHGKEEKPYPETKPIEDYPQTLTPDQREERAAGLGREIRQETGANGVTVHAFPPRRSPDKGK